MVAGSLRTYDSVVNASGILYRVVDTPSVRLGGLHAQTEYSVAIEPPISTSPSRAYLEIGLLVKEPSIPKWRLWLNSIAITREFKPSFMVELESGLYAKTVYDLKPVLASQKPPYRIVIQYNGSPEIEVADLVLTALYPDEDGKVTYSSVSGALILEPGERYSISLPKASTKLDVSAVVRLPNKFAKLIFRCGEHEVPVHGYAGWREVSLHCTGSSLEVEYVKLTEPYYPRKALIVSIFASHEVRKEPVLEVRVVGSDEGFAAEVFNKGMVPPESAILLVFQRGIVVKRVELPSIEPGGKFKVDLGSEARGATLRLVWRYKGKTKLIEYKVR